MSSVHLPRKESRCLTAAVVIAVSPIFHFIADPLGFQMQHLSEGILFLVHCLCVYNVYHRCIYV